MQLPECPNPVYSALCGERRPATMGSSFTQLLTYKKAAKKVLNGLG